MIFFLLGLTQLPLKQILLHKSAICQIGTYCKVEAEYTHIHPHQAGIFALNLQLLMQTTTPINSHTKDILDWNDLKQVCLGRAHLFLLPQITDVRVHVQQELKERRKEQHGSRLKFCGQTVE